MRASDKLMPLVGVALAAFAAGSLIVFSLVAQNAGAPFHQGPGLPALQVIGGSSAPITLPGQLTETEVPGESSSEETAIPIATTVASVATGTPVDTGISAVPAAPALRPADARAEKPSPSSGGMIALLTKAFGVAAIQEAGHVAATDAHPHPNGKAWGYWGLAPGQLKHGKAGRATPPADHPDHPHTQQQSSDAAAYEPEESESSPDDGHAYGHDKHADDTRTDTDAGEAESQPGNGHAYGHEKNADKHAAKGKPKN